MEQGRRPDQMEYSAKASFYCIIAAFILAVIFSFVQPFFNQELGQMAMIFKSITSK